MFKFSDIAFLRYLFPISEEPKDVQKWRWAVSLTLTLLLIVNGLHIPYSLGYWGSGFVTQVQFSAMQGQVSSLIRISLEENINRTKIRQCTALKMRNQEALNAANSDLNRMQTEYHALFQRWYQLPSCMELLIDTET